jgi:anti-sigma factor RsiW
MSMKQIVGFFKCLFHFSECQRTKKLLYEFVEGELTPDTHRKLEKHLGDCPACLDYVKSYRATIELTHRHCLPDKPMPPSLKQKLHEFIQQNPDLK